MRKLFSCIGIMGLLGAFLTGCSMGPEQMKSVPIEDPAKVETLHEITKDAMKNYFDVDVNDGVERKLEGFESYVLLDVPTESYLYRNNVIKATMESKPQEGQIASYGASLNPETNELTGAIVVTYSEAQPQDLTVEQQQEIAMNFIKEKNLVANPDSLIFEGIEKGMSNNQYSGLKFKNGDDVLLVSVSLQTGKVTHFEFVEVIEPVEPAETPAK